MHRNRRYPPRSERPPPISITVNTTQCSARHTATHRHGHSTASYLRVVTADGREETHPLQLGAGGVDPAGLALRRSVGKQPPQLLREWKLKIALQRGRRRDVDRRVPSRPERYTVLSRALHTATGRHGRAPASSSGLCSRACQVCGTDDRARTAGRWRCDRAPAPVCGGVIAGFRHRRARRADAAVPIIAAVTTVRAEVTHAGGLAGATVAGHCRSCAVHGGAPWFV